MVIEAEEDRQILDKFQLIADDWKKKRGKSDCDEILQVNKEKVVIVRKSLMKH